MCNIFDPYSCPKSDPNSIHSQWDEVNDAATASYRRCGQSSSAKTNCTGFLGRKVIGLDLTNEHSKLTEASHGHIKWNKAISTLITQQKVIHAGESGIDFSDGRGSL